MIKCRATAVSSNHKQLVVHHLKVAMVDAYGWHADPHVGVGGLLGLSAGGQIQRHVSVATNLEQRQKERERESVSYEIKILSKIIVTQRERRREEETAQCAVHLWCNTCT